MKEKEQTHPKLYLGIIKTNNSLSFSYQQNTFNKDGSRKIEFEEILHNNNSDESVLKAKNRKELEILKRYIKKQKRVLEKYEKVRNYTASEVMKNSILLLKEFEKDFVCWFEDNKD